MENGIRSDERSYRRGLVLGLTMAEVFILLLFALLLIWMIGIQKERKSDQRIKELMQQVEEGTRRVNELKEMVNFLAAGRVSGNQFDDLFRELRLRQEEAVALGRSAKLLQELGKQAGMPGASPEQVAERIRERIQIAGKVLEAARTSSLAGSRDKRDEGLAGTIAALVEAQEGLKSAGLDVKEAAALGRSAKLLQELGKQAGVPGGSPEQIAEGIRERVRIAGQVIDAAKTSPLSDTGNLSSQQLAETIAALGEVREALKSSGLDAKQAPMLVRQTIDQLREKDLRLKTVEGRLRNAERVLKSAGRGTEKPACWADPETGKPEYIFDVALKSKNLLVRDNAIPHRREEQARLPLQETRFDKDVSLQEFRNMTRALFLWSEKEGCRFFVKVFDITQTHEKDRYKLHLRTVGEHFYYYEELNRPWTVQNDKAAP